MRAGKGERMASSIVFRNGIESKKQRGDYTGLFIDRGGNGLIVRLLLL